MWEKQIIEHAIVLEWGHDNGDDIFIQEELSEVTHERYNFLTKSFGNPHGSVKTIVVFNFNWVHENVG